MHQHIVLVVAFYHLLLLLSMRVSVCSADEVCYEELGCFTDSKPFGNSVARPFSALPEPPEKVGTLFFLFTRRTPSVGELITSAHVGASFVRGAPTKLIIHGFRGTAAKRWVVQMRAALLRAGDYNVIAVDWSRANGFPYSRASTNTQIVGAQIAQLVRTLSEMGGVHLDDVHLIGFSLGSHVAGYAGSRLNGSLGRITGLDPAGPYFQRTDPLVRLDPSDAQFVDVVHTDGSDGLLPNGFGMIQTAGHVDFYPNGGLNQPGCSPTSSKLLTALLALRAFDYKYLKEQVACSHHAAHRFFIDSITNKECHYTAYPCADKKEFDAGNCLQCGANGCNRMGFWAKPNRDGGRLFLRTDSPAVDSATATATEAATAAGAESTSMCRSSYAVTLIADDLEGVRKAKGHFAIQFRSVNNETSSTEVLDSSKTVFRADSVHTRLVSIAQCLQSPVDRLFISYNKTRSLLSRFSKSDYSKWTFKYVDVFDGERQTTLRFCPPDGDEKLLPAWFHRCPAR